MKSATPTGAASLNNTTALVGIAAPASVNKASPVDDASTKVMFGSQTPEIAAVYSLIPKKVNPAMSQWGLKVHVSKPFSGKHLDLE